MMKPICDETARIEVEINTTPEQVFDAWLDSTTPSKMLNVPVKMSKKVGGEFRVELSRTDVHSGRIVELVPGKRIVEVYRLSGWEEGVYSILVVNLEAKGKCTKLILDHIGLPRNCGCERGWREFYLPQIKQYFEAS